jgi:hypothetical protein
MIGTSGPFPRDPYRMRPHKQSVYYDTKPRGRNIMWEGPGWYAVAAKKTLIIRVG